MVTKIVFFRLTATFSPTIGWISGYLGYLRGGRLQHCNRQARFRRRSGGNVPVFTRPRGTVANFAPENDNNNTKNSNDMEFYDEYYDEYDNDFGSSYGRYAGSYAQDIEGYDDETIDEAFDGDPEAYWNID